VSVGCRLSRMRAYALTLSLLLAGGSTLLPFWSDAQSPVSVESRLATQNVLFDEYYQNRLRESPELATYLGDDRYNNRLDDHSLAGIVRRAAADDAFLARLRVISTAGFPERDTLSHDLLLRILTDDRAYRDLKDYEMPLTQFKGIHTDLANLPLLVPLDSVKHYEDYIARLHQIPLALTQTEGVLRAGINDNLMPVKFLLENVPVQCNGIIAADPFLSPIKKFPPSFSAESL
jgi:uncharacterized protein (DUF885 family)